MLTSISAFEGFAEDFTAVMMAHRGSSFAEIAKRIGQWNNPTLKEFSDMMTSTFGVFGSAIAAAATVETYEFPYVKSGTAVARTKMWPEVVNESRSWMQVRHLLTHGLTTGWRSE